MFTMFSVESLDLILISKLNIYIVFKFFSGQ